MRKVSLSSKIDVSKEKFWEVLTKIEDYPKYVKFMQSAKLFNGVKVGAKWEDTTRILLIPVRIMHRTTSFREKEEISFEVDLPLGGKMLQQIKIEGENSTTRVQGEVSFDLGNPLFNFLFGPILQMRIRQMLEGTLENFKNSYGNY